MQPRTPLGDRTNEAKLSCDDVLDWALACGGWNDGSEDDEEVQPATPPPLPAMQATPPPPAGPPRRVRTPVQAARGRAEE